MWELCYFIWVGCFLFHVLVLYTYCASKNGHYSNNFTELLHICTNVQEALPMASMLALVASLAFAVVLAKC